MRRQWFGAIAAALLGLLAAGCWGRYELQGRAPVRVIRFDLAEETGWLRVTLMIPRVLNARAPAAGAGSVPAPEEIPWAISATGRTPAEAIQNLEERSERKLFFHHSRVILVGEELARSGLSSVLDFIDRHPEIRLRAWMVVARGSFLVNSRLELLPGVAIDRQITGRGHTGTASAINLNEFFQKLAGTTAPVASVLTPVPRPSEQEPYESGRPGMQVSGTAVFRADRLAGYLDPFQTRGLRLAVGDLAVSTITVPCPDDPERYASVTLTRNWARRRAGWSGGRPQVSLALHSRGNLVSYTCPGDPMRPGTWERLEAALAKELRSEVLSALEHAQRWKADIFGFGEDVHRSAPNAWPGLKARWDELFSELKVDVAVEASIRRIGTVTRPTVPPPVPDEGG